MFYILSTSEWLTVLSLTSDHTQKGLVRKLNRTSVSFLGPSMKNNTASIMKSIEIYPTSYYPV